MKTKTIASSLPLLAGIALGIVSLSIPFLIANHWITTGTGRYNVDNYLFFFWGKYYTVTGTQQIMSQMVMYDLGDFPIYAMVVVAVGIIVGALSTIAGRGLIINVKGRVLSIKLDVNPLWLQTAAVGILLFAYLYMGQAIKGFEQVLLMANYEITNGPAFDFLAGSIVAFVISTVMTGLKFWKEETKKEQLEKMKTVSVVGSRVED